MTNEPTGTAANPFPNFAAAKKAATAYKVACNQDRTPREKKSESYFVGSDIAARPAVFLRDKEIGRTYCVRSFEYLDA